MTFESLKIIPNQETNENKMKFLQEWKQIAVAVCVSLGDASQGMAMAFSSSALPQMMTPNPDLYVTEAEASIIAGTVIAFAAFGNLLSGFLSDVLGRKRVLVLCSFMIPLGYIMVAMATDVVLVVEGRAVIGLFTGISILTGTVYVSEITQTSIRGSLLVLLFLSATVGHLIEFILGALTQNWRMMTWLSLPIPLVFFLATLFLPESPRYLLAKGKEEEAILSMTSLRHNKCDAEDELQEIKRHMVSEEEVLKGAPSFKPYMLKVLFCSLVLAILHGCSGGRLLVMFAEPISIKMRTYVSPKLVPIGLGLSEILGQAMAMLSVDKLGRRRLLQISGGGMFLMWTSLLAFTLFAPSMSTQTSLLDVVPVVLLLLVVLCFNIGYRSVFYGLVAEILPQEIRGKGTGAAIFVCAASVTALSGGLLPMISSIHLSGTFLVFSCTCFFTFLFPTLFVPETKGKTLEEIENLIKDKGVFMGITAK